MNTGTKWGFSPEAQQTDAVIVNNGIENPHVEQKLETDPNCRFRYASEVIGLDDSDVNVMHRNRQLTESFVRDIVDRVYEKMFQFLPMKRHFTEQHHGFYGHVPARLQDVSLDDQLTQFRKRRLEEFLKKLSTARHDETFVVLLDMLGKMHTPTQGNPALSVPLMQVTVLLGFISDQFTLEVSKLKLKADERTALQRAYGKLFWVMNNMFIRHYT